MRDEKPSITAVLSHYGGEVDSLRFGWVPVRCIWHEDKTPSARINEDECRYQCFVCDISEDSIGMVMRVEQLRFPEALERAKEIVGEGHGEVRQRIDFRGRAVFAKPGDRKRRRAWRPPWVLRGTGARS